MTRATDPDVAFDLELPRRLQGVSAIHFTPTRVAQQAAAMLAPRAGMRVLDVGAGPGKFCIVAARAVPQATFVGIEVRANLVHIARKLAARFAVTNVEFFEGDAMDLAWDRFDAFYFYNPFGEHVHETAHVIDRTLDRSAVTYARSVQIVRDGLAATRAGTRVVTYHGFGAEPPDGS